MYKIRDLQFGCRYFGGDRGIIFKSKKEIVNQLASYHDIDFTGADMEDNELSIWEFFRFYKINTIKEQLNYLLQYGQWEIEKVRG